MRVFEKLQKNLVFVCALLLVLSSLGGAPALAWIHTDGSSCYVCPLDELVAASTENCCAPAEPVISATDCQICCEPRGHEQSRRKVLPASVAVLAKRSATTPLFQILSQARSAQDSLTWQAPLHSPPTLRGPPVCGRFSTVMRLL